MKKNLLIIGAVALIALSSCVKDKDFDQQELNPAKDMSAIDNSFEEMYSMIDKIARTEPGIREYGFPECVSVSIDTISNPKSITIDCGETNCLFSNGVNYRGVIQVTFTGRYRDVGTVITTTLEEYHVNDYHLEGEHVVTNMGYNASGNLYYSVDIVGAQLTAPDNSWTSTWQSSREREWTNGENTIWNPFDDVYSITGEGNGISRNGTPYDIVITNPLIVKIGCRWIVQGKASVIRPSAEDFTVDFGTGTCDNLAVVNIYDNDYQISMY